MGWARRVRSSAQPDAHRRCLFANVGEVMAPFSVIGRHTVELVDVDSVVVYMPCRTLTGEPVPAYAGRAGST
ncbi:hypothetical protein ACFQZ4_17290 [Catellatospora coxensis]